MKIAELREGYSYLRQLPANYLERDADRFFQIRMCNVDSAYLNHEKDAKICQYYVFSDGQILEDFCLPIQKRGNINLLKQWLKLKLFPLTKIDKGIWVSDVWSKNYFHWILECLPRILAVRDLGFNAPLILPEHIYYTSYVRESLTDFGIDTITFNFRQSVSISSIYLPSHDSPCAFDPSYLKRLINKYADIDRYLPEVSNRRIYISRKDASKRKVSNEHEIIPILLDFGFEVVQMEKLSFRQQRDLMRETGVLLSIHGAGLANMIFMPTESSIIELHPDVERYNSCFYHLATAIGIDYYYSFEKGDHANPQEANISVDVSNLLTILRTL